MFYTLFIHLLAKSPYSMSEMAAYISEIAKYTGNTVLENDNKDFNPPLNHFISFKLKTCKS